MRFLIHIRECFQIYYVLFGPDLGLDLFLCAIPR